VKSDVVGAFVSVAGSVDDEGDDTGAISIGGALRGGAAANSGTIFAGDDIASVKIGQGIIGGAGPPSGSIESGGKIGNVVLGNSLLAGSGTLSGSIISGVTLGASTISGDLSGRIVAKGNLLPKNNALASSPWRIWSGNVQVRNRTLDVLAAILAMKMETHFDVELISVDASERVSESIMRCRLLRGGRVLGATLCYPPLVFLYFGLSDF